MNTTIQPPATGALDPAFSFAGIQKLELDLHHTVTEAQGLAFAPDGSVYIAGTEEDGYALIRIDSDGDPDLNFGSVGAATGEFDIFESRASTVQVLPDGRHILKGYAHTGSEIYPAVACLSKYGFIEKSFGTNGWVILAPPFANMNWSGFKPTEHTLPVTKPGSRQPAPARQIHAGKKILVSARIDSKTAIVSLTGTGSLDTSFGSTGYALVERGQPGISLEVIHDLSGKLLAAGSRTAPGETIPRPYLTRYNSDGSVDTAFGNQGSITIASVAGHFTDLVVTSTGKIVGVGYTLEAGQEKAMLMGRNQDGSPDSAFNKGAPVITSVDNLPCAWMSGAIALVQQRIVVSGGTYGTHSVALVGRFNSNGSPDLSFGNSGLVKLDLGQHTHCGDALVQSDQKILICGEFNEYNTNYGYVARFLG